MGEEVFSVELDQYAVLLKDCCQSEDRGMVSDVNAWQWFWEDIDKMSGRRGAWFEFLKLLVLLSVIIREVKG